MEFQKLTNMERWKSEEWLILTFTLNYLKYKELRKSEGWLILATSPLTPSFSKSYKGSEGKNQKIKIFFFYIPAILCYIYFFFSSNFFFSENNPSSFKLLENQGLKGEGCILHDPSLFLHFFSNYLENQGLKGEGCILHDPSLFLHFFSNYLKNQGLKGEGCILHFCVVIFKKKGVLWKNKQLLRN